MRVAAPGSEPVSDLDPFDEGFLADPFPGLARLRAAGPAVYLSRYDCWAVARYREVHAVLRDHQRFSSSAGVGLADLSAAGYGWRPPSLLLETDPPAHARHRAAVVSALSPRALRSFQDSFDAEAAVIVDDLVRRESFDAVTDLAEVFPTVVFPRALGVLGEVGPRMLVYGALSFNAIGPRNQRLLNCLSAAEGLTEWVQERCQRENLLPGSIGAAVYQAADAAGHTEEETGQLVRSLFSAGVDTTVSGLSFAVQHLASSPGQWDLVRAKPSLARAAFEEAIRYESPVIGFFRTTTVEVPLGTAQIPPGSKVLVLYAGANRDPERWPDADVFDVRRKTAGHLGYGAGPHVCAGMAIARMEGESVIRALAERIERWELAGPVRFRLTNSLRGLASLPVRVISR